MYFNTLKGLRSQGEYFKKDYGLKESTLILKRGLTFQSKYFKGD